MKRLALLILAASLVATPAAAQDMGMDHESGSVAGVRSVYETVRGFIMATANQVPEDMYSYRPTEEVRTMGGILGHVADAAYLFCSAAKGEQSPSQGGAENLTAKADIVQALTDAFAYCDGAYQLDTMTAGEPVTFFGQQHTRLSVLAFNMGHTYEHYGNLVTYMRMNGMVPPSSQGGM